MKAAGPTAGRGAAGSVAAGPGLARETCLVAGRELAGLFFSPLAYFALTAVALAMSLFFFDNLRAFNAEVALLQAQAMFTDLMAADLPADVNLLDRVMYPTAVQTAFVLVAVVPLVTMGVFCEERARRTAELLYTLPLRTGSIVAGKFLATGVFLVAVILVAVLLPAIAVAVTGIAHGPLAASAIGLLALAFAIGTVGLLCSALAPNQLVAALAAYASSSALMDLGWLIPFADETLGRILQHVSLLTHFAAFPRGVIAGADLLYFALWCGAGLLLTRAALELERLE